MLDTYFFTGLKISETKENKASASLPMNGSSTYLGSLLKLFKAGKCVFGERTGSADTPDAIYHSIIASV
jgi:hypothetical protein